MQGKWVRTGGLATMALLIAAVPALAQFSAGSSGVHGTFPPFPAGQTSIPSGGRYLLWDMTTGLIRYCSAYDTTTRPSTCTTEVGTAQIPGIPEGGLRTGVFEFVDVNVVPAASTGNRVDIYFVNNVWNAPLTILSQNAARFTNTFIWADGRPGQGNTGPLMPTVSLPGGLGGPGGFAGGSGGIPAATVVDGSPGFGPAGGAGSAHPGCSSAPGFQQAGVSAGANPPVATLLGGSGGGGGSSWPSCTVGRTQGGSGGGGGGAVLIAADDLISLASGEVTVEGGRGGSAQCNCMYGGGGAGGRVRLTAPTITGTNTALSLGGGFNSQGGQGAGGVLQIEGNTSTFNPSIQGVPTVTIVATPGAVVPAGTPTIRITAIGDIAVGPNPAGVFSAPDAIFQEAPGGPVPVAIAASNVPVGTEVRVRVTPQAGVATEVTSTALTGTTESSSATADVTLPGGYGTVTASATFTCTSTLCAFLPPDQRDGALVEVIASAEGVSRAFVVTADGKRVALD